MLYPPPSLSINSPPTTCLPSRAVVLTEGRAPPPVLSPRAKDTLCLNATGHIPELCLCWCHCTPPHTGPSVMSHRDRNAKILTSESKGRCQHLSPALFTPHWSRATSSLGPTSSVTLQEGCVCSDTLWSDSLLGLTGEWARPRLKKYAVLYFSAFGYLIPG